VCCICSVPEVKRKKLDNHSEKYIFIRYSEKSKAYKLHNPLTKKLVVSRDVVFNEAEVWSWCNEEIVVSCLKIIKDKSSDANLPTQRLHFN